MFTIIFLSSGYFLLLQYDFLSYCWNNIYYNSFALIKYNPFLYKILITMSIYIAFKRSFLFIFS